MERTAAVLSVRALMGTGDISCGFALRTGCTIVLLRTRLLNDSGGSPRVLVVGSNNALAHMATTADRMWASRHGRDAA